MVRRNKDYVISLHYEHPSDTKQLFFLKTVLEHCTHDQMMHSVIDLIDTLQEKLQARVTCLEVTDFNTGRIIKTEFKEIPGPIRSTKELKEYESSRSVK